jgi:predicted DNA-binding transcriptional regulator AlpA
MSYRTDTSAIPDALKNFDLLPDLANVRQPVVKVLYACSDASVWRGVHAGRIPKPRKLSPGTTAWNVGELRVSLATVGRKVEGENES